MNIQFFNDYRSDFDSSNIQNSIKTILLQIKNDEKIILDEIRIIWVTDHQLKDLHQDFLDDSTYTDVITFDLGEDAELYISVDRAKAVHKAHKFTLEKELIYYAIHGFLHLCGYDDHAQEDIVNMRNAEKKYLTQI